MTAAKVQIPYVRKDVHDLLMWEDPKKSGACFGGITLVFGILYFSGLPLLAILAYTVFTVVVVCAIWSRFGKTIGKPMPEMPQMLREGISEADWKRYADTAKPHVDKATGLAYSLLTCQNVALSVKVALGAFAVGKVVTFIPIFLLAYLCVLFAFVAPKVYEQNKDKIDAGLAKGKKEALMLYSKGMEQVAKVFAKVSSATKKSVKKTE